MKETASLTAIDLAHAPELPILIALDSVLEMATLTMELALPELDLQRRDPHRFSPRLDDPDLAVAQEILDLVAALRDTLEIYRNLAIQT